MKWLLLLPLVNFSAFAKQEQRYKMEGNSRLATEEWNLFGKVSKVVKVGNVSPENARETSNYLTFKEWRVYRDEFISFRYPKSSKVSITRLKGDELGVLVDNKVRASKLDYYQYQIRINNKVTMTLDYTKVEGFGTYSHYRSPYMMNHEQFRVIGKALAKYRFWVGGVLSDVQISNDKELVKCLITDDPSATGGLLRLLDKERVASSIRLTSPSGKTKEEWIELVNKRANWKGICSFLYKGMPLREVIRLLGKPSMLVSQGRRVWLKQGNNYPLRLELKFDSNDNLESLPHFGVESDYSKPIVGGPAWIKNITNRRLYLLGLPYKKIFGEPVISKQTKDESANDPEFERYTTREVKLTDINKVKIQEALFKLMASPRIRLRDQSSSLASKLIKKWRLDPTPFANLVLKHKIVGVSAAKILRRSNPEIFKDWVTVELDKLYVKTWTRKFT